MRRPVFTHDHEGARLDDQSAAGAASLSPGVALFAAPLGFAVETADGGAETDTDSGQGQDLGFAGVAHAADYGVGLRYLAELFEQL